MKGMKIFLIIAGIFLALLLLFVFKFMFRTIRDKGDLSKNIEKVEVQELVELR